MQASGKFPKHFLAYERDLATTLSGIGASASQFLTLSNKVADVAIAILSVLGAFILTNLAALPGQVAGFLALRISVKNLLLLIIFSFLWSSTCRLFGLYRNQNRNLGFETILRLLAATLTGSLLALIFVVTSRAGAFRLDTVLVFWAISIILSISARGLLNALTVSGNSGKHPRQVLIVGSGARALHLYHELSGGSATDYRVLGFVDNAGPPSQSIQVKERMLGELAELESILVNNVVDEVLITLPVKSFYTDIDNAIRVCERVGVESKYLSDIFAPSYATSGYEHLEGFAVTSLKPVVDDVRFVFKRAIDLIGAVLGIVLLSPLFVISAVAIKLTSDGPVIFKQERHGRNRRRFKMYKFRTMVQNAEALQPSLEPQNEAVGPVFKIRDDPRVTRVGAILRRTSLDELPQLVNVLKGEMSLVGPRPLPTRDVSRFEGGWLLRRFCVLPGMTGLWQISGRSAIRFEDWVQHDFHYIDGWSLKLDLKILLKTVPVVWKGGGAV